MIYIINGPNLDMLGTREPAIYGVTTLEQIEKAAVDRAGELGYECKCFQSNTEGEIINIIHHALNNAKGIIINAGAFSHYSYAICDAISSVGVPVVEVHLSNIYTRDEFRHKSVLSAVSKGVICGFGGHSYILAIEALNELLR